MPRMTFIICLGSLNILQKIRNIAQPWTQLSHHPSGLWINREMLVCSGSLDLSIAKFKKSEYCSTSNASGTFWEE